MSQKMAPLSNRNVTSDEFTIMLLAAPEIWRHVNDIRYEFAPGVIYYGYDGSIYHFGKYGWEILRIIE